MKILKREKITREWVKHKFSLKTDDFHRCVHSTKKDKECHAFPQILEDNYCIRIHIDNIPRIQFIYKWMCWIRYIKDSKILINDQYHLLYEALKIFGYKYKDSKKDFLYIELIKKISNYVLTKCNLHSAYLRQRENEKELWLKMILAEKRRKEFWLKEFNLTNQKNIIEE